ncbi:MAG: MiaB/RimO family radical SAM methylthiotransferase [Immundisolibacterales bacterium]|nr:MiaB/RimO family radical SAM methylthiotransferase [Immundisolibacterales bacterium]
MTSNREKVSFRTLGCRLNQYDTESIRTLLEASGRYEAVRGEADVCVVNTCSVTARADASARKAIRRIHAENPEARIVVTGCYAQRAPEELSGLPGVSLVLGAADRGRVVEELERTVRGRAARVAVAPIAEARKFLEVPISEMRERRRAFVKVQEGCNESCSFCIIPKTRGVSRSRDPDAVLAQVRRLVEGGYPEIVVTGVHAGDYGLDLAARAPSSLAHGSPIAGAGAGGARRPLVDLIERILAVPGLERFRLSSIEPASVGDDLVSLMAGEEKFARHFHIPMQSANDGVLDRMRRRYTADGFRRLVGGIAERVPDCGIGTDVICGFPGESDAAFQDTFDALVELPVTYIHPFTYSPRPGSESAGWKDDVPAEVKKRRGGALKRLSRDKGRAFRERHVGQAARVLPEGPEGVGWTDNYIRVEVAGGGAFAGVVPVMLAELTADGMRGTPVTRGSSSPDP